MSDGVLFLIPARGGSVRVPGKNLRTVAGIPLIGRAARLADRSARLIPGGPHAVVCSTDDPSIAAAARDWGAEVLVRPAALATADASSVDVALHAVERLAATGRTFRAVVLVQPTSPLTDVSDVIGVVARFDAALAPVTTVLLTHPAAWHFAGEAGAALVAPGAVGPADAPTPADAVLLLTGAVYAIAPAELARERRFVIPGRTVAHSVPFPRSLDVDEAADLALADVLVRLGSPRLVVLDHDLPAGMRIEIGGGRCFVIAEAGVNHDGDLGRAHRLVDAAAHAGADAVKFQTFDAARLASAGAPTAAYQREGGRAGDLQVPMLERLALPADAWAGLKEHAHDRRIAFLSSPFDEASADLLERVGVPAFKVASGELTNHPFLRHLARKGRPLLVSTGMATILEVAEAVDVVGHLAGAAGPPPGLVLLHCVSSYPARPEDANLSAMCTLRAAFGIPVGWSDHTPGIAVPTAAVALGADMIEKHLTLDRTLTGPDHRASLEPDEFGSLVASVRATEAARGTGSKEPVAAELPIAAIARKSLHWTRDLADGATVTDGDLVAMRPGSGIPPSRIGVLVGRRLARRVAAGSVVDPRDLTPEE